MQWSRIRPALARARQLIPERKPENRPGSAALSCGCAAVPSALDSLTAALNREVKELTERLTQKGLKVPPSLQAKLDMLQEVISLASHGEPLPLERLHQVHNALLVDLDPAQLTQLRDGLLQMSRDKGRFVQLPKRPVPGLPATLGEVSSLLTGISHRPANAAEVLNAPSDLGEAARSALSDEATRFAQGEINPLPVLPSTLKSARKQLQRIERDLGLAAGHPARQRNLIAARDTLTQLITQMELSKRPTALSRTRGLVGVVGGVSLIPNLAAAYVEGGVSVGVKGLHTGVRRIEPYGMLTGSTAIGSPGYFASKSQSRSCWNVNLPFLGLGSHPVMGKTLQVFVPGLFTFQVGTAGAVGLKVMAPLQVFGLFGGVSVLVRSPKLALVTSPIVEAAFRSGKHLGKPLEPMAQRAGTLWRSARERARVVPGFIQTERDGRPEAASPSSA